MRNFVLLLKFSIFSAFLFGVEAQSNQISIEVVAKNNMPMSDMVVYLLPKFDVGTLPENTNTVVIEQKNKKFAPYVTVAQKGQQIRFENADDITHHIYSVSGENGFDFKIKSGQSLQSPTMLSAEEVAMGCNIHDWMSGYVLVVDTPFFGLTNSEGITSFNINKSGEYLLVVWHPQMDEDNNRIEQAVEIDVDQAQNRWKMQLKSLLLPIPSQENEDDFDFLEEY